MTNLFKHKCTLFPVFIALTACIQGNGTSPDNKTENSNREAAKNIITRDFPVYADFTQITNIGSFNIDITEGPCSIQATGDSASIANLIYDIDGGCLTLSLPSEENIDVNSYNLQSNVRVNISMPQVNILTNCGGGTINYTGTLHTDNLHIGGIGMGWIHTDSIICNSFKYESNRQTDARFKHISCKEGVCITGGTAKTELNMEASQSAVFDLSGNCNVDVKSKAPFIDIVSSADGKSTFLLDADSVNVSSNGTENMTLRGKAHVSKIKKNKESVIENRMHSERRAF